MSDWISAEDELPVEGYYIFATKTVGVKYGFLSGYAAKYKRPEALVGDRCCQFTHWQPLPESPKGAKK